MIVHNTPYAAIANSFIRYPLILPIDTVTVKYYTYLIVYFYMIQSN